MSIAQQIILVQRCRWTLQSHSARNPRSSMGVLPSTEGLSNIHENSICCKGQIGWRTWLVRVLLTKALTCRLIHEPATFTKHATLKGRSMDWLSIGVGFLSGLFVGSNLGILILGLCRIGTDRRLRPDDTSPFSRKDPFQEKRLSVPETSLRA